MDNISTVQIKIPNSKPKPELFGLLALFLLCAGVATWWAIQINEPLTQSTIMVGIGLSVLWVMVGVLVMRQSVTSVGTLTINPEQKQFVLNSKLYRFEDLNFYRSTLIAPTFWGATGYSMQTIEIGVGKTRYKISDDIAAKLFNNEQYDALVLLNQTNGLTVEENASFLNWLERVQETREHASPNPESSKS